MAKRPSTQHRAGGHLSWFARHPATWFLGLASATVVLPLFVYAPGSPEEPGGALTSAQRLELCDTPLWLTADLKSLVIQDGQLDQVSFDDPAAVQRVAAALTTQSWIQAVRRIEKTANHIRATVQFRHPVAVVELPDFHLLPVDADGVILNGQQMELEHIGRLIRIRVENPASAAMLTGQAWPDRRVTAAASIASMFATDEDNSGVRRVLLDHPYSTRPDRLPPFYLDLASGQRVVWGRAPGYEETGEASAQAKRQLIRQFADQSLAMDALIDQPIDIRAGRPVRQPRIDHATRHSTPPSDETRQGNTTMFPFTHAEGSGLRAVEPR